jgi:broad specificity phosphatase PhoE
MSTHNLESGLEAYPMIHLVRHGRIADYQADEPLTLEGANEAIAIGREWAAEIRRGEIIRFFSAPARRTRQTASLLKKSLCEELIRRDIPVTVKPVVEVDDRLRICQLFMGGTSYDLTKALTDVALWRLQEEPSREHEMCANYLKSFWGSDDPIGYWLSHPSEVVEPPRATATRTQEYIAKRLGLGRGEGELGRDICVTHSANIRVLLESAFGKDLGDPSFCATVTITGGLVYYAGQIRKFANPSTA